MYLAGKLALSYLPMDSLLAWGSTCRDNYAAVNTELRLSLEALVGRFFPDPSAFLEMLIPWSGLIVGEAALSHVLHEPSICKTSLEIAISNIYFTAFLRSLSRLLPYGSLLDARVVKPPPRGYSFHRHISRIAEYRLMSGLFIVVYGSCTPSACDVVSGYWTTALMNFVTARTLGCAYPRLTLRKRALLCKSRSSSMDWADRAMAMTLDRFGFKMGYGVHNWLVHGSRDTTPGQSTMVGCGQALYVCPQQARFFGDGGSLVIFHDGFAADLKEMRQLSVAPYGLMVAWRLPSTGSCEGGCMQCDDVLPRNAISMLMMFLDDATGSPLSQRLVERVSDTLCLNLTLTPPTSRCASRRYSF